MRSEMPIPLFAHPSSRVLRSTCKIGALIADVGRTVQPQQEACRPPERIVSAPEDCVDCRLYGRRVWVWHRAAAELVDLEHDGLMFALVAFEHSKNLLMIGRELRGAVETEHADRVLRQKFLLG